MTELATGGELSAALNSAGVGGGERMAQRFLVQLALAVRHMHARRVVHRDLKLEVSLFSLVSAYFRNVMCSSRSVLIF